MISQRDLETCFAMPVKCNDDLWRRGFAVDMKHVLLQFLLLYGETFEFILKCFCNV